MLFSLTHSNYSCNLGLKSIYIKLSLLVEKQQDYDLNLKAFKMITEVGETIGVEKMKGQRADIGEKMMGVKQVEEVGGG